MSDTNELLSGNLERVDEIASRLFGKKLPGSTVFRWVRLGISGCRLPAIKLGRSWMTTEDAFRKWIEQTTASAMPEARR